MLIPWWGYTIIGFVLYLMGFISGQAAGKATVQQGIIAGLLRPPGTLPPLAMTRGVSNAAEKPQGQRDAE